MAPREHDTDATRTQGRPADDMARPLADAGLDDRVIWGVVEAAPDGIVMADLTGKVLLVNQRTEELFGYDRGELLGKSVDLLLPEALREAHRDHRMEFADGPRTRAMGAGLELRGRRRDGSEFPVEISLSPVTGSGPTAVIATVRDMTDRLVIEMENRAIRHQLVRTEDRERIARDLHDTVIQRLFAAGMTLQGAAARVTDSDARTRVEAAVDELDATIKEIRQAIFALQAPPDGGPGLRGELVRVANELRPALGFSPRLQFDGAIEVIDPLVAENLVPVLREALSNVARHASASEVRVIVTAHDEVALEVLDDGVGIPDSVVGGNGLGNLTARAENLGGRCAARRRDGGGSVLEWRVPAHPTSH
jgi:two-component system, NarL family, sensor histidine kinase DevS